MEFKIITCSQATARFAWEIAVQLNNMRENSLSANCQVLLFSFKDHSPHPQFKLLEKEFPETQFFYYSDENDIYLDINYFDYIPLIRPYMLRKHFKDFPELSKIPVIYIDTDVLFLNSEFISPLLSDNICYISDAHSYLDFDYLKSKEKDVIPEKLNEYRRIDVIKGLCDIGEISVEEFKKKEIGGVHYILKGIDSRFWSNVYVLCCSIRGYLRMINKKYFESEDKGIQSWCADLWAVLFCLWKFNIPTKISTELNFAWATDRIEYPLKNILHNAGVLSEGVIRSSDRDENGNRIHYEAPAFYKGNINSPFHPSQEELLNSVISHPISKQFYTSIYTQNILTTKNKLLCQKI